MPANQSLDTHNDAWLICIAFRTHPSPRKGLSPPIESVGVITTTLMLPESGLRAIAERLYVKAASCPAES